MNPLIRMTAAISFAASFASAPSYAQRNDVLIVVNDNSVDSVQVGAHYAAQRDVVNTNIVHIKSPNQYFIEWADFQSLRDQILRFGICPTVPAEQRPAACADTAQPIYTEATVNALTAATPIRHIVMTRGVPTQFRVEPPDTTYDSLPPIDNYLRFWLARYFATDSRFSSFKEREKAFGNGDGMRNIQPATDREYAIGRIDGVNLESTIALIDRTIAAEQSGVFGKVFGSDGDGGLRPWMNHATGQSVYVSGQPWRYLFPVFNENRPECSDYTSTSHYFAFGQSTTQGRSPDYCLAQFQKSGEHAPAHPSSRHPRPLNALMYIGSLDGQTLGAGFTQLVNWRREASCVTLCSETSDPAACRATSTDPVKEINTACVGVEPGFIGYQHQSFPLSYYGIWPTAWTPQAGGGQKMDVPRVDTSRGYDDSYSLWFDRTDEVISPQCYPYSNGVLGGTPQTCKSNRVLALRNSVTVTGFNPATPASYRLRFRYNVEALPASSAIASRLVFVYLKPAGVACPTGFAGSTTGSECTSTSAVNHPLAAGNSPGWVLVDRVAAPPAVPDGMTFNYIRVEFIGTLPGGNIGLDTVSLTDMNTNAELLANGSFNDGHRQTGTGDYAALFLGRLGGTAFWGSTSHHFTGGHAFESNALETVIYFMRGLPLAEAVWFDDDSETGLLYGDPLYSPLAVRLNPIGQWNYLQESTVQPLSGSTINGRGPQVMTTYSVHYCSGSDPYLCGSASNPWLATGIEYQPGKFANQALGSWNTTGLSPGAYTLRLSVTSSSGGKTQTFNDFLPIKIMSATSDFDNDGLTDVAEINTYHTDPNRADSDSDGMKDGQEVNILHTDPNDRDSDDDGIADSNEDPDGDGYNNYMELNFGGNPLDPAVVPLAFVGLPIGGFELETGIPFSFQLQTTWPGVTFQVSSYTPMPPGMSVSPTGQISWTPGYSQGPGGEAEGYYLVFVQATHPNLPGPISQFLSFAVTYGNTGDINEDGGNDVADAALLQRHLLGLSMLSDRQRGRADLAPSGAPDGVIDFADLQALTGGILQAQ